MSLTVLKFGGSSVGSPRRLLRATSIVERAHGAGRILVVVSALAGVTNALERAASRAARGERLGERFADVLRRRHRRLLSATVLPGAALAAFPRLEPLLAALATRLDEIAGRAAITPLERAWVLAAGERLSVRVLAAALAARGLPAEAVDATQLIAAGGIALEAEWDPAGTSALARLWQRTAPALPVVTGFLAGDSQGNTVLLGRGGSDFTATALAAALGAGRVEIWTDTDGVLTADPRLEPGAASHATLDPLTASTLARLGARVLHARTLEPLAGSATEVVVRDTARPRRPGTRITPAGRPRAATIVSGAALVRLASGGSEPPSALAGSLRAHGVPVLVSPLDDAAYLPATSVACARAVVGDAARFLPGPLEARLVAVVPSSPAAAPPRAVARALADAGVFPLVPVGAVLNGVSAAIVAEEDLAAAVRALHAAFVRPRRAVVDVALAGARGGVGRALLRRLARGAAAQDVRLRLVAAFDTRGAVFDAGGLDPATVEASLAGAEPRTLDAVLGRLRTRRGAALIVVDCTASEDLARRHASLLSEGIGLVTANKLSLGGPLAHWRTLRKAARRAPLRAATTVGAGLPVLATVRALHRRGDALWSVRASFSGTLSFVLAAVEGGLPLSRAVALAREQGLTEPHPAVDLSGADVARKLLILLREAGIALEEDAVRVEPLVPASVLAAADAPALLAALAHHDEAFAARVAEARSRGRRLVFIAAWDGCRASAGLAEIEPDDAIARAHAGENVVRLRTALHDDVPLVIAGPGAGVEVTAAGVHGDLLSAARALLVAGRARAESARGPASRMRTGRTAERGHDPAWA